jgi:hypothetical protein
MEFELSGYLGNTLVRWPVLEGETHVGRSSTNFVKLPYDSGHARTL